MRYSRKVGPPIVSAAVATLVLTNFATVSILKDDATGRFELFKSSKAFDGPVHRKQHGFAEGVS